MDPGYLNPGCVGGPTVLPSTAYSAAGYSIGPQGEHRTDERRAKMSGSMKKKLKNLRKSGVDTSNLSLNDVISMTSAKQNISTWSQAPDGNQSMDVPVPKILAARKKKFRGVRKPRFNTANLNIENVISMAMTSNKTSPTWCLTPGGDPFMHEGKRKMCDGPTGRKKRKVSNACVSVVSGINIAIIPKNRPKDAITEEDAERIKLQIIEKIDSMEAGAPRFEGCKYVDGYLGLICSDQDTFQFMRDFFESSEYEVVETKDLPSRTKVVAYLPEKAEANLIFKRLTVQNPGLNCQEWTVIGSKITETGFLLFLAIDEVSHDLLVNQGLKMNYLLSSISILVVAEKDGELPGY